MSEGIAERGKIGSRVERCEIGDSARKKKTRLWRVELNLAELVLAQ